MSHVMGFSGWAAVPAFSAALPSKMICLTPDRMPTLDLLGSI